MEAVAMQLTNRNFRITAQINPTKICLQFALFLFSFQQKVRSSILFYRTIKTSFQKESKSLILQEIEKVKGQISTIIAITINDANIKQFSPNGI